MPAALVEEVLDHRELARAGDLVVDVPADGEVEHTHRAIDDARGYAHLLVEVLRRTRARAS